LIPYEKTCFTIYTSHQIKATNNQYLPEPLVFLVVKLEMNEVFILTFIAFLVRKNSISAGRRPDSEKEI
jgi:hypothetical protein